ncbi:spermidine N1-acetyltransferase [Candidatus Schneideria nysicola]|uniref:spermidine N1-acetyltransferase n=1 Tax=Candidatus Schneideria nysicola TaxID=1081631 RepID=UPI001CAA5118|nr:spermidine N1-acetyltransferase [Candidatus Schneideria nysicola]UAJ65170.1 spermidine N1-acetyltransferase [Candidatus Schneideria nysicola]UAJ65704.1 spermidine N1-acetyltransferase [Candidatus Schneideria nysicola]UAJ66231.1 spermidine N1-acetyltransferase [Candidatus Schneideria nysicola]
MQENKFSKINKTIRLRPLEREDLHFIHQLNNNKMMMKYWFEEPHEAYVELKDIYNKNIHNINERRFIIDKTGINIGLVELVDIDHIHRRAEFSILIVPEHQGKGYASTATHLALNFSFMVLNLHKLYLIVDKDNIKAIHIYNKLGFKQEGVLLQEFFVNGQYRDTLRMCIFQREYHSFYNKMGE